MRAWILGKPYTVPEAFVIVESDRVSCTKMYLRSEVELRYSTQVAGL